MILGIGTDITEIRRIREDLAKLGSRFETRVFTESEIAYCRAQQDPAPHYAARWAAKEAVVKALGLGWSKGIGWRDVEVWRGNSGEPRIVLHSKAAEHAKTLGAVDLKISLSHDGDMALAFCIVQSLESSQIVQGIEADFFFELEMEKELRIRGNIHLPAGTEKVPVFILCHGFKGFKDWGWVPWICNELAKQGIAAIRFNFSMNGIGNGVDEFEDVEGFSANTIGRELEDLRILFNAIQTGILPNSNRLDIRKILLGGHSRGGGVAILYGIENPQDARGIVALAPVSHFNHYEIDPEEWKSKGRMPILNTRTGQQLPLRYEIYEDLIANQKRYDLMDRLSLLQLPLLILHGDQDETVPVHEGRRIVTKIGLRAKLKTLEGANHTFGGAHPFLNPNRYLRIILEEIKTFCKECAG